MTLVNLLSFLKFNFNICKMMIIWQIAGFYGLEGIYVYSSRTDKSLKNAYYISHMTFQCNFLHIYLPSISTCEFLGRTWLYSPSMVVSSILELLGSLKQMIIEAYPKTHWFNWPDFTSGHWWCFSKSSPVGLICHQGWQPPYWVLKYLLNECCLSYNAFLRLS